MSYYIKIPEINYLYINDLFVEKSINNHSILSLSLLIDRGNIESYKKLINKEINLALVNSETEEYFFCGIIKKIEVNYDKGDFSLNINAYSYSYEMDLDLKQVAFQNTDKSYGDIIDTLNEKYKFIFVKNKIFFKKINKFFLQYNETDFMFLKRILSEINCFLIVDDISSKLDDFYVYIIDKSIVNDDIININIDNYTINISDELVEYSFISDKIYKIGDLVILDDKELMIKNISHKFENSYLNNYYTLVKNYKVEEIENDISGLSLRAKVINNKFVKGNEGKLQIQFIDIEDKENNRYWFNLNTIYSSNNDGLLFIPEINETVNLYFPNNNESNSFINSVFKNEISKKIKTPHDKIISNSFDKEIMLNKEEIKLSSLNDEVFILLTEKKIIFKNKNSTIEMTKDDILLKNKKTKIKIDNNDILIKSENIKLNS